MKTFNWKEFMSYKIAVHFKTEKECNDFLRIAKKHGLVLGNGVPLSDRKYFDDGDSCTCYEMGFEEPLTHASFSYYNGKGFTILEWSDYMEFTKEDLKVGMLVETEFGLGMIMPTDKFNVVAYEKCRWGDVNFNYIKKVWGRPLEYGDTLSFDVNFRPLLYERSTVKEMTVEEISKALGYDVKIVKG